MEVRLCFLIFMMMNKTKGLLVTKQIFQLKLVKQQKTNWIGFDSINITKLLINKY